MKKLFIIGLALSVLGLMGLGLTPVQAQTWHNVNQFTCAWDAVTTDDNGDSLPVDGEMHYRLYIANADTDPDKTNPVQVYDGIDLQTIVTLNIKGRYYVGVQAVWIYTDNSELASIINWADEIEYQGTIDLWAIRYYVAPMPPENLTR